MAYCCVPQVQQAHPVFAGYGNVDYDDKGEDDIFSLGMRHSF